MKRPTPHYRCWSVDCTRLSLRSMLAWAIDEAHADRLSMALRLEGPAGNRAASVRTMEHWVQRTFRASILEKHLARAWPATELFDHPGLIIVLKLTQELADKVVGIQSSLFKWRHDSNPPLPEDLWA